MKNKIKQYIQEIVYIPKGKNQIIRKNIFPIVKDINNTILKNDSLYSINNDTNIFLELPECGQYFKIISRIKSDNKNLLSQLFYKNKNEENFTEENSVGLGNADGDLKVHYFNAGKLVDEFRLDSINGNGKFSIEYFEIIKISALEYYIKTRKYKKFFDVLKLVIDKPFLIIKFIKELKNNGFHYTIQKVKNYINKTNNLNGFENDLIEIEKVLKNYDVKYDYSLKLNKPIDIIIPVYNGFEFLEPLFNSIKENTTIPYRLIVIDDKSPDKRVKNFLKNKQKEFNDFILLENDENVGFIKSVNKAVKYVENHFVLLNTDTEVPKDWLQRLMYPIIKMERIASTTPFTNAGTIASFPNFLEDNEIFLGLDVNTIDSYFKRLRPDEFYSEVPSGVGFCMGINYNVYKKIGMFDEVFGKGYGEENDWCQKAIKEGYKNILVPNLFVYHKHGGSFLDEEKKQLIKNNLQILLNKYPNYIKDVENYIINNELEVVREFFKLVISSKEFQNLIIIFDHNLGGGANFYRKNLIKEYLENSNNVLNVLWDNNLQCFIFEFYFNNEILRFKLYNIKYLNNLLEIIAIKEIFVNNLVSYPNIFDILNIIEKIVKNRRIDLIIPIHDFFPICPSYNLLNEEGVYCDVPDNIDLCQKCLKNNTQEWKIFYYDDKIDIKDYRAKWEKLLTLSSKILCFSYSSKKILLKAYPNLDEKKFLIKPHKIKSLEIINKDINFDKEKINIGILGAINYAKGSNIIKSLVRKIDKEALNYKVILIGEINESIISNNFVVTGRYNLEELPNLIKQYDIDIFLIPSICPETFSYTTEEIMSMQMPLIVFDLGAPAERVKKYNKGIVVKDINSDKILEVLEKLKDLKTNNEKYINK